MEQRSAPERVYGWIRIHPYSVDALFAAGGVLFLVFPQYLIGGQLDLVVAFAMVGSLALRRRSPVACAALVALAGFAQLRVTGTLMAADVAAPIACYSLAAYGPKWAGRLALGLGAVGAAAVGVWLSDGLPEQAVTFTVLTAAVLLAAWALGQVRRLGRREQERLLERARLLEIERDQEARLAATAERARIAREMHDVVAHSLAVTVAQADGGRYAAARDPAAAVAALETISATGRQALADMRALLGVLREDTGEERAPQPGATDIPRLVEQLAAGGLDVEFDVEGHPTELPTGSGLAAYRIVQESLTNVLKHAGPGARARVRLSWLPQALDVLVADDGRGAAARAAQDGSQPGGQGIMGMRERAALYGGQLDAAPRPGGGFAVHAVLPYVPPR
jgi:signal transduction histidine kinase